MAKSSKRDTVTYELKNGNELLYVGTTNDLDRRLAEHKAAGKSFTGHKVTSPKRTEVGAKRKEAERLATYRQNHGNRNPKDNKDSDG